MPQSFGVVTRWKETDKQINLGLIVLIVELFRISLLDEFIIHECIGKLLADKDNPEDAGIEAVCVLLTAVGQLLDHLRGNVQLDSYFSEMKMIADNGKTSYRICAVIQDVTRL